MIAYTDALKIIQRSATPPVATSVKTSDALHRVLAEDFMAPLALPRFDNSSMDGFALRAEDTLSASADNPLTLPVLLAQAAGDAASSNQPGHTVEIMTGAAMPQHADAVIPIENVTTHCDSQGAVTHITLTRPVPLHDNVRFAGEDFANGQRLITAGSRMTPAHIAILFGTGTTHINVVALPKVSIFTTGKEVSDDYEAPLASSQIYNSNTPYLMAELQTIGIPTVCAGHIGDDEQKFRAMLAEQKDAQILVSSGAVSKGKWDFIPAVLEELGAEILFHRVAIKPGKPVLFARFPDGRYFFGLPGNPISAAIGLRFFMMPLLRRLLGLADELPVFARLTTPYSKKGPLRLFLKAQTQITPNGTLAITLLDGQESFKIAPLLQTNAWAVLDETTGSYPVGQPIMFYPVQLLA
jgi:molybdopterin molybdotransferase